MRFRLGVRTRLLLAVVGAVALALAIGVVAFNLVLGQRLSASATALAKAQAEAELSSITVRNGALVAPEGPDEGTVSSHVWVFEGSHALEAPRVPARIDSAARSLANGPERSLEVAEEARLYAIPVSQGGTRYGTVVAAVPLDPYEETGRTAMIGSLALAALLLGAITLISRWMLGRALLPVSRMTESAARWSEHDPGQRFGQGEPYDELTRLAATLDTLLERIAASLRHEQRFTAELSHELRTPLARLKGETELMLRRERTPEEYRAALEAVDRNVDEMTRTVETLVAAARHEAGLTHTTSDLREAVSKAVDAAPPDRKLRMRLELPDEPVRVAAEQELLTRIVQPLLDNACRYGRTAVEVAVVQDGTLACVNVVDDGPGVTDDESERIFEPGTRGSAASAQPGSTEMRDRGALDWAARTRRGAHRPGAGPTGAETRTGSGLARPDERTARADPWIQAQSQGAGLGLSLARRLARSAGGDVTATPGATGGRFSVQLPLAR